MTLGGLPHNPRSGDGWERKVTIVECADARSSRFNALYREEDNTKNENVQHDVIDNKS